LALDDQNHLSVHKDTSLLNTDTLDTLTLSLFAIFANAKGFTGKTLDAVCPSLPAIALFV
jgi:hypothetical protein